jgi:hypothetical protein
LIKLSLITMLFLLTNHSPDFQGDFSCLVDVRFQHCLMHLALLDS